MNLISEFNNMVRQNETAYEELSKYYNANKDNPVLSNDFRDIALKRFTPMSSGQLSGIKDEFSKLITATRDKAELEHIMKRLDQLIQQEARKKSEIKKTLNDWIEEDRAILRANKL